jgi:2-keto-4-pentenoate hydratase
LTAPRIADLARQQLADYDAHTPGLVFADRAFSLTVAEAYAVQREMARLRACRGERVCGYKIGCVSKAVQQQLGIHTPVFGYLFETEMFRSGVLLDTSRFECLAIEGEFAVRVGQDIPGVAWLREHPARAIASVFPVIELHNNVFRGCRGTAQELVANNAFHAGVVLPSAEVPWGGDPADVERKSISVFRGRESLGTASASALPGGPLASLLEVLENLGPNGLRLRRDDIVLTGSPLPLYPAASGDHITVESPGSGMAELILSTQPVPAS